MTITRRQLIQGAGAAAGLSLTRPALGHFAAPALQPLPDPASSGLDHIVVLCMENRSFDHYLGWLPGANGRQAGLTYTDDEGKRHGTRHLTDRTGCGHPDPEHGFKGGRAQFNNGRCDGFMRGDNDEYAIGYYRSEDLPAYAAITREFTTFDKYFCSMLGPTYPNRLYTHSAATDRISNLNELCTLPTVWDQLMAKGIPCNYFFSDLPVLALYGPKYPSIARPVETFFTQAQLGALPAYSYVDPFFIGAEQGGSNDDHPFADIHRGQAFVSRVVRALMSSPQWSRTALIVTYDEWGGFFDHVRPPRLPDDHDTGPKGPDDHAQAGFRVPTFAVSPFARRGYVGHAQYDHASILKMVEWRFGLTPMTKRDAAARNLAESFDFARPNLRSPDVIPAVADPGPTLCDAGEGAPDSFWLELAESPLVRSWGL